MNASDVPTCDHCGLFLSPGGPDVLMYRQETEADGDEAVTAMVLVHGACAPAFREENGIPHPGDSAAA